MKNEPLVIKKRGEDGSRVITVRLKEDILASLDQLAAESNYSRNELINIILRHAKTNPIGIQVVILPKESLRANQ